MEEDCCGWDFLEWVGPDTSACVSRRDVLEVLDLDSSACLDDPADLVRAAAVSHSWRRFVLENDNRIFVCLNGAFVSTTKPSMDCIKHCIGASSTDNFPVESMENTLEPYDGVTHRLSYWSSGGQVNPDVPESLTYKLKPDIFIIDGFRVQPFKAYFQPGHPIYSSKTVRIRMGHSKLPHLSESFVTDEDENQMAIADENYVWTYTSPEFPMLQKNVLQSFKLPRPVLCIGGVVKIELLGRVQKRAADDRYYICVCHAQVIGRSFSPVKVIRA